MTAIMESRTVSGAWPQGTMRTLQMAAPGELEIAEVEIPGPAAGQVLVEVSHVGICGTDVHLLSGHSAYVVGGLTRYPIRFGHEWSGTVVAAGDGVGADWLGARVVGEPFLSCGQCAVCRAGHYNLCPTRSEIGVRGDIPGAASQYFRVPVTNIARVPDGVPGELALMAEPSVTVINSFETGAIQPGERVAVVGTGAIGLIAVQLGVSMGCPVDVLGIDEAGLAAALANGARRTLAPDAAPDDAYDVVLDATGSSALGTLLTRIAAIGGRILQVGIPGRPSDGVDLASFVTKGLSLRGVLGGVHLLPRALGLIADGRIRPAELLDEVLPVADAVDAFARSTAVGRARPKIVLDMRTLREASAL
jgi:2-desacetyl-2-hydroxyethyl bacteriochlorophyllide A dehydrogenase